MNSLLYHDPYYDPTIVSVHTMLNPLPYQQPTYFNTPPSQSSQYNSPFYKQPQKFPTPAHHNAFSKPPTTFTTSRTTPNVTHLSSHTSPTPFFQQQPTHNVYQEHTHQLIPPPSHHTPFVSSTDIGSLLNQISYSQELLKHSLSVFAEEVSYLKTNLTSLSHINTQPWISYNPFHHQAPPSNSNNLQTHNASHYQASIHQHPTPSLHNTQHPSLMVEPTPLPTGHAFQQQACISLQPFNHHTPVCTTILQPQHGFSTPTLTRETKIEKIQELVTIGKIISTAVSQNGFVLATEIVEPKINVGVETHGNDGIGVEGNEFSNISDLISEIMDEQKGFVTFRSDLVSDSVQERKQHFTEAGEDLNQSRLELNSSNVVFSVVNADISAAMDQRVITVDFFVNNYVRPFALINVHPLILDPGGIERGVRSLAAIFGHAVGVFDPEGDERNFGSPVLISINNHGTRSSLQVPWWDRGKLGLSKSPISFKSFEWFPVTVFDPGRDKFSPVADSGGSRRILSLLWLPWDRGKKSCNGAVFAIAGLQCRCVVEIVCLFGYSDWRSGLNEWTVLFRTHWASKLLREGRRPICF